MIFHIVRILNNKVNIILRVDGPGFLGDIFVDVGPGEAFEGYSFRELGGLGLGQHKSKAA